MAHMSPCAQIQGPGSRGVSGDIPLWWSQSPGHQDGDRSKTVVELVQKTSWWEGNKSGVARGAPGGEPQPPHHHKGPPSWVLHLWLSKDQGDVTEAGRRKVLADASSLAQGPALHMLQGDAGDSSCPRVTLQELWAHSCRWEKAPEAGSQKDTKGESKGSHQEGSTCEPASRSGAGSTSPALAVLAGCWSSSCCWIWPKEQQLNLLSSAAHRQPSWAGTATHHCAQTLCSAVGLSLWPEMRFRH